MKLLQYLQKKHSLSRRDVLSMLQEQAIFVNKDCVDDLMSTIAIGDMLEISLPDGTVHSERIDSLPQMRPMIVAFHKPKGYVVSKDDPHNKTIYELLPDSWHKDFWYIGRLDKDSHGLLLLTNDSALVDHYENPRSKIKKVYEVQVDKPLSGSAKTRAMKGLWVDQDGIHRSQNAGGERYTKKKSVTEPNHPVENLSCSHISYHNEKGKHRVTIVLTEGKKRHIRRLLIAMGYKVLDLYRTQVGLYRIDGIKAEKWQIHPFKDRPTRKEGVKKTSSKKLAGKKPLSKKKKALMKRKKK